MFMANFFDKSDLTRKDVDEIVSDTLKNCDDGELYFENSKSESILLDDLKMYAISRLYLDNFPHVKAYWPMLGRDAAQLTLSYGVNDIDGTIDDTTKIYSMAGSEEQNPAMTTAQLVALIKQAKRAPIERGTLYNVIKDYSTVEVAENEA